MEEDFLDTCTQDEIEGGFLIYSRQGFLQGTVRKVWGVWHAKDCLGEEEYFVERDEAVTFLFQ